MTWWTWWTVGSLLVAAGPARAGKLQRVVEEALDHGVLDGASIGLVVMDDEGRAVVSVDPNRRLIPASTAKWITAAAAAHTLSLDYRFETRISATGFSEGDALHGDLVVVGAGDPSLGDPDPGRVVADVLQLLAEVGIRRVEGDLVVDASRFDGAPYGPGWMWDDLAYAYSAPYTAANVAHNLAWPGLLTAPACAAHDGPGSPLVDPPGCLAALLHAGLVAGGIEIAGKPEVRPMPEAVPIGSLASPPLRELLRKVLVDSDNLYAECIARALDQRPVAEASEARARIEEVLAAAGVRPGRVSLVDGSGLSRYSFASAAAMVRVSAWVRDQPWGPDLLELLPVAGEVGTLAGRMRGTPAEGRVRAKTGSMTGVRNLVGFVEAANGEPLTFAFLINGVAASPAEVIAVQDRVVALLAASNGRRVKRKVAEAVLGGGG